MKADDRESGIERILDEIISLDTKPRAAELEKISQQNPELARRIAERLKFLNDPSPLDRSDEIAPDHNTARLKYGGRRGFLVGFVIFLIFFVWDYKTDRWSDEPDHLLFVAHLIAVVTLGTSLFYAYFLTKPSSILLIVCEKASLVATVMFMLVFQFCELRFYSDIVIGNDPWREGLGDFLNDSFSLRWAVVIFAYVLFAPRPNFGSNDEKHYRIWPTVKLVCGIAGCPLLLNFCFCYWHGNIEAGRSMCFETAIWLIAAATPAIYGHYVIEGTIRGERVLGAWGNLRKIGNGGFATVYKATHRSYSQDVAIKFLKQKIFRRWGARSQFRTEAEAMAKLSHPHLVRIYHYDPGFDDLAYIVMEFVDGRTLESIVKSHGKLEPSRVVHILRQVLSALGEIHSHGMIHRDISAQNVMLCRYTGVFDFVKVLDLGIVFDSSETQLRTNGERPWFEAGNPRYMSPEQERGDEELDLRCDIFCVGALAYRLLTERHLKLDRISFKEYGEREPRQILLDCGCPTDLCEILMKCVELERGKRFDSADHLITALNGVACARGWNDADAAAWWELAK